MATIETIANVEKHPNADALELATILGYQCVVPIGKYKPGGEVVYIRPDSVLPKDQEWAQPFLKYAKTRVKAMKLRGEWSEGIVLDLDVKGEIGCDVSSRLGVTHYVAPGPQEAGAIGALPYDIPKTDEKRWEEIVRKLPFGEKVDVTLKVDGQSWSAFYKVDDDEFGILGRRVNYIVEEINNYTAHVYRYGFKDRFIDYCKRHHVSLCIRGESYGQGIQNLKSNPHSKIPKGLAIFSVYLIDERRYAGKGDPHYFVNVAKEIGVPTVPIIEEDVVLTRELIDRYNKDLKKLDGEFFEGVVIKGGDFSFKVINKHYDSLK